MVKEESNDAKEQTVYGGLEGPNSMYVKLVSSDDQEFIIKREYALESGTIKAMFSGPGQVKENEVNVIRLHKIPSHILQKVCEYLQYKVQYDNSTPEAPEFPIEPEISWDLLIASSFLDC